MRFYAATFAVPGNKENGCPNTPLFWLFPAYPTDKEILAEIKRENPDLLKDMRTRLIIEALTRSLESSREDYAATLAATPDKSCGGVHGPTGAHLQIQTVDINPAVVSMLLKDSRLDKPVHSKPLKIKKASA